MIYKDLNNKLHDIDPAYAWRLPDGCVQITDEEAQAIRDAEIAQIESQIEHIKAPPTPEKIKEVLAGVGLSEQVIESIFTAASQL